MKRVLFVLCLLAVAAAVHASRPERRGPFPSFVTSISDPEQFLAEMDVYLHGYPLQTQCHADSVGPGGPLILDTEWLERINADGARREAEKRRWWHFGD